MVQLFFSPPLLPNSSLVFQLLNQSQSRARRGNKPQSGMARSFSGSSDASATYKTVGEKKRAAQSQIPQSPRPLLPDPRSALARVRDRYVHWLASWRYLSDVDGAFTLI